MENSYQQPSRDHKRGWLILLLSVAAGLVTLWLPFGLCIAPALWAYAGARTRPWWMALPMAVYAAGAFSLYSPVAAAGLFGAAALCAGLVYSLLTRRVSNVYTALTLSGVFLAGLYASVCLPGILAGKGAFADVQAAVAPLFDFYHSALAQMPGVDSQAAALLTETLDAYSKAIPSMVVPALCIFSGVLGLSNLLFFRLFSRKHAQITLSPMRAFRDWTLPRSMTFGLFALLIGSLILEWTGWAYADSLSNTVDAIVGMPLLLQGLCVVDFLISRSPKNVTLGRALAYSAIGVLFGLAQTPLILVGCFDQIFRFRDRMRGVPPRAAV